MQQRGKILSNVDWGTILVYLLLVFMGWLNIYAAVYSDEHSSIIDFSQRYGKQLVWVGFAVVLGFLILFSDSRIYSVFGYVFYTLIVLALISTLFFGREVNASKSWIQLGAFGIQPAEFAKVATALALAKLMGNYDFKLSGIISYIKVGLIIMIPAGIILLQNDTGSALVFAAFILVLFREGLPGWILLFFTFLVALFVFTLVLNTTTIVIILYAFALVIALTQRVKLRDLFRITFLAVAVGTLLYLANQFFSLRLSVKLTILLPVLSVCIVGAIYALVSRMPRMLIPIGFLLITLGFSLSTEYVFEHVLDVHHQKRINDLLGIESDPLGWGYNVNQSKIAIGSGGFWGKGYLEGTQTKFNFVPEQSTDFIFCTVGEEWGFMGSVTVVSLIVFLLLRILKIAERQREPFSRIYGYAVVSILFFHAAVNIGMTIGLVPVIGIPLPFFSYGGSSLWAFTILLFILLKLDSDRYGSAG